MKPEERQKYRQEQAKPVIDVFCMARNLYSQWRQCSIQSKSICNRREEVSYGISEQPVSANQQQQSRKCNLAICCMKKTVAVLKFGQGSKGKRRILLCSRNRLCQWVKCRTVFHAFVQYAAVHQRDYSRILPWSDKMIAKNSMFNIMPGQICSGID